MGAWGWLLYWEQISPPDYSPLGPWEREPFRAHPVRAQGSWNWRARAEGGRWGSLEAWASRERPPAAVGADPAPPRAPAVGWGGPAPPDCVLCTSLTQVPDGCGGWEQPKPRVAGEPSLKLEGSICPGVQPPAPTPTPGSSAGPWPGVVGAFPLPHQGSDLGAQVDSLCVPTFQPALETAACEVALSV